jgi:hypothetical protein
MLEFNTLNIMTDQELKRLKQAEVLEAFKEDVLQLKASFQTNSQKPNRYAYVKIGTFLSNRNDPDGKTLTKLNYREISKVNDTLVHVTGLYLQWLLDEIDRQFKEL